MAQSIYYSLQVAYPESRVQLDRPDLKLKLMQLTAKWTMGAPFAGTGFE